MFLAVQQGIAAGCCVNFSMILTEVTSVSK